MGRGRGICGGDQDGDSSAKLILMLIIIIMKVIIRSNTRVLGCLLYFLLPFTGHSIPIIIVPEM